MESRTKKILIISAIGIFVLGAIAWFIYKSIPAEDGGGAPPVSTTVTNPGLIELASGFLAGGWLSNIFGGGKPKDEPVKCVSGCDENRPGRDCDGFLDPANCGAGRFGR